jgi:hypothetical protein
MYAWIVAASLCGCDCGSTSAARPATASVKAVADELASLVTTGTLICTRGDCLAVRVYTASSVTHVASVVVQKDGPWVYESTNGVGVRKLSLADFLQTQTPNHFRVYRPHQKLTDTQSAAFEKYLEDQLGRPYSVKHHVTGNRCRGLHCAEYATEALSRTELITVENSVKVSPASLIEGVVQNGIYDELVDRDIVEPEPPADPDRNCCERLWDGTKSLCASATRKLSGWILCR